MFFYVGGIAALTMVINATTANQLLVYLGLLGNDSAEKNLVMQQIKKRLRRRMDRYNTYFCMHCSLVAYAMLWSAREFAFFV
jgi:hypothetical protein